MRSPRRRLWSLAERGPGGANFAFSVHLFVHKFRLLPLLFLLSLAPARLWAWGVDGHRAVGRLAEQHLSRRTRREVRALLGPETLVMVSTWPDEIRYSPEFKDTAPWHYVNTPLGFDRAAYEQHLRAQPEANAYNQLQAQLAILKDKTKPPAERASALKFVVHLVGDVHQPLHTGRAEDQGGNKIKVTFRGKETNLHSLWDSGLLDYQGLTYTEMGHDYNQGLRARQVRQWQHAPLEQWLFESYQAAERLYAEAEKSPDLDYRYYPAHAELLKQRIQQAGIRLAGVLNEALK